MLPSIWFLPLSFRAVICHVSALHTPCSHTHTQTDTHRAVNNMNKWDSAVCVQPPWGQTRLTYTHNGWWTNASSMISITACCITWCLVACVSFVWLGVCLCEGCTWMECVHSFSNKANPAPRFSFPPKPTYFILNVPYSFFFSTRVFNEAHPS